MDKEYKVAWQISGYIYIEAGDKKEAREKVKVMSNGDLIDNSNCCLEIVEAEEI